MESLIHTFNMLIKYLLCLRLCASVCMHTNAFYYQFDVLLKQPVAPKCIPWCIQLAVNICVAFMLVGTPSKHIFICNYVSASIQKSLSKQNFT